MLARRFCSSPCPCFRTTRPSRCTNASRSRSTGCILKRFGCSRKESCASKDAPLRFWSEGEIGGQNPPHVGDQARREDHEKQEDVFEKARPTTMEKRDRG